MATDWLEIGSQRMLSARRKQRLSVEEVARRVTRNGYRVVGRTVDRWEKKGAVPRPSLEAVCAVLGIDAGAILADQPTRVQWQQISEALSEVVATQQVLVGLLEEQRTVVGELARLADRLDRVAVVIERREASN